MRLRLFALLVCAVFGACVAGAMPASAQTLLDEAIADPPSVPIKEFRDLAPVGRPSNENAWGVSAGGTYVVGESDGWAVVWTPNFGGPGPDNPVILDLPTQVVPIDEFVVTFSAQARAMTSDGNMIVGRDEYAHTISGSGDLAYVFRALYWTKPANAEWSSSIAANVLLPPEMFDAAGARGVSDNAKFVAGWTAISESGFVGSNRLAPGLIEAWATYWTDGANPVQLPRLGEDDASAANGVAAAGDGSPVVVGWSGNADDFDPTETYNRVAIGSDSASNVNETDWMPHAFVWTPDGGTDALETLGGVGTRSDATAISSDASTIVGWSNGETTVIEGEPLAYEAVRWTRQNGGWSDPQPLGGLNVKGTTSAGTVALGVSEEGDAVVGYGTFPGEGIAIRAFVWTTSFGGPMRYLGDALTEAGVALPEDWAFYSANAVRSLPDSFVIVGNGAFSDDPAFIVRLARNGQSGVSGVTTATDQGNSYASVAEALQSTNVDPSLWALADMAENHRCIRPQYGTAPTPWCFFGFGTAGAFGATHIDDGSLFFGDAGLAYYFSPVTSIGASIGGGTTEADLRYGGDYQADSIRYGVYAAHVPDKGLRILGVATLGDLTDIDIDRAYPNGAGRAVSSGHTDATAWGLLGRIGWGFAIGERSLLTPFAQVNYTASDYDGWTEHGGPFPAVFGGANTDATTGRVGAQAEADLSASWRLYGSAAWVHLFEEDEPVLIGTTLGLFTFAGIAPGDASDWAEFVAGSRYQLSQRDVLSLSGRIATEFDDFYALNGRVGYSHIF